MTKVLCTFAFSPALVEGTVGYAACACGYDYSQN
jgi:hypothetical protein